MGLSQNLSQENSARQEGWGGRFTSIAPNEPCDSGSVTEKPASMAGFDHLTRCFYLENLVAMGGIEPPTSGL